MNPLDQPVASLRPEVRGALNLAQQHLALTSQERERQLHPRNARAQHRLRAKHWRKLQTQMNRAFRFAQAATR